MSYGDDGRTTLDDTLEMCARTSVGGAVVPVFVPDLIKAEHKGSEALENHGYTAMRNWSVGNGFRKGYDYVFHIENDVRVQPNTLLRLLEHSKDMIMPRYEYPGYPPMSLMCWSPQPPHEAYSGLIRLHWAAHTVWLLTRQGYDKVKATGVRMFKGYRHEGADHTYWSHKLQMGIYMDLDTPVDVLASPRGFKMFDDVPFTVHKSKGRWCKGQMSLAWRKQYMVCYKCNKCSHSVTHVPPSKLRLPMREPNQSED